jgi:adenylylsulfate kinase-like enzyme
MRNKVLWFTGLSGSGKTTIAKGLLGDLVKIE